MSAFFGLLALVGGTLLVCQVIATLLGLGGDDAFDGADGLDADFEVETDSPGDGHGGGHGDGHASVHSTLVGALSLRTLTAAATFGGLAGLIGTDLHWPPWQTALAALLAGGAALLSVHRVMRTLHGLRADGTVSTEGVAGSYGTVYVRVPADGAGAGKVLLEYAGRTVEMAATTDGPELPSGTPIIVRAVTGPDVADVAAVGPAPAVLGSPPAGSPPAGSPPAAAA